MLDALEIRKEIARLEYEESSYPNYAKLATLYTIRAEMNKENDMEKKNKKGSLADRIPHQVWLLISFAAAMALWTLLSVIPATSRAFPNVFKVLGSIKTMIDRGVLWNDISSSLISVVSGYALGFVIALPVAILMAWYKPVRYIIEPWIQFIRNIPPLAYVPLIVIAAGVGRKPQIIVITIACFLIMCACSARRIRISSSASWLRLPCRSS